MLGTLTAEQIEGLLWSEVVGRIGCHVDTRIYVVPIQYVYDGHHAYMQSCDGMKLRAMRRDPSVCFEVDQVSDLTHWQSVIAAGVFEPLEGQAAERARKLLVTRISPLVKGECAWPVDFTPRASGVLEERGKSRPVYFRLRLSEKTGRFESP